MRNGAVRDDRRFGICVASHMLALAARALFRAACRYGLFNFQSESVQVLGRLGENLPFSIGDESTQ